MLVNTSIAEFNRQANNLYLAPTAVTKLSTVVIREDIKTHLKDGTQSLLRDQKKRKRQIY